MNSRRAIRRLTVALFVLALVAPAVDMFLRPHAVRSVLSENRTPAPAPSPITDLATLTQFPTACERWFADRMGGRDLLLRQWQRLCWIELGLDPLPMILRGLDGCVFYPFDGAAEVHRGERPYSAAELAVMTRSLESHRDRCRRLGAEFLFVIAPDKETIYPDKWPTARAPIGPTRFEQLLAWLRQHSDVRCVDLRPALVLERKFDRPAVDDCVYYPHGSHFTWRGGLAAWNEIARELNKLFPSVRPISRTDYELEETAVALDSSWERTYVADLVMQRGWVLTPRPGAVPTTESKDPALPTCLFVHDSFGPWMTPFAERSFSRMWPMREHRVPREQIERHRPMVVIHEMTERRLIYGFGDPGYDVLYVTAAEFQAFDPYFGPVDCAGDPALRTSGGVTIRSSEEGCVIEQRARDGVIDLPPANLAEGSELALHMRLEAPFEADMLLYFLTGNEKQYARARVVGLALKAGENDLFLRLLVPGLTGSVRVGLSGLGDYRLHEFEMRVAR